MVDMTEQVIATRERVSDDVADVIWWLKGYRAACESSGAPCDFGGKHLESLAEVNTDYRHRTRGITA